MVFQIVKLGIHSGSWVILRMIDAQRVNNVKTNRRTDGQKALIANTRILYYLGWLKVFLQFQWVHTEMTQFCTQYEKQGIQEKLRFFTIHCNPSLAYIAVRDFQSSQRNASVQSLLLAGNFLNNQ